MRSIAAAWTMVLEELGYKPEEDPHLKGTPERVARYMHEWDTRRKEPPVITTFDAERYDGMITSEWIPLYSMCAHHGLPFIGQAAISYIPDKKRLAGLSKFARIVDYYSHRYTVQERLTTDVADHLWKVLEPRGLGVQVRAEHYCISMRGAHKPGIRTTTTIIRGCYDKPGVREEFLQCVR